MVWDSIQLPPKIKQKIPLPHRESIDSTAVYSIDKDQNTMNPINQNNLHLLLPGKISWLIACLHDDYGLSLQDSLLRIYHSELYKKLSTESTKYWHLGPVDLYRELKSELYEQ